MDTAIKVRRIGNTNVSEIEHVQISATATPAFVRHSPRMLELARLVERIAPRKISVLVLGETGTGKELIARELHDKSARSHGPLQVVNCGAIPEHLTASVLFGHVRGAFTGADRDHQGVFGRAHGGSVFLDEVGELSAEAQAALLRVLDTQRVCPIGGRQEQSVDVRVIAATHRNLAEMVERGSFRLDLYHRLNSVVLQLPSLRERRDEILPLAEHFIERFVGDGTAPRLSHAANARLLAYAWPGNVRELRNVIERAVALCDGESICERDLPPHICQGLTGNAERPLTAASPPLSAALDASAIGLREALRQQEIALIEAALRSTHGNQKRAARLLQLPLRTFERKLSVLSIKRDW
ncbi:MAG TPA: sigma-54 dependent transcriptional regulator [Polyangiales bacterium]|nr:sigma-54 dependent transcriptional regulator [Polyangiales bacterium]